MECRCGWENRVIDTLCGISLKAGFGIKSYWYFSFGCIPYGSPHVTTIRERNPSSVLRLRASCVGTYLSSVFLVTTTDT